MNNFSSYALGIWHYHFPHLGKILLYAANEQGPHREGVEAMEDISRAARSFLKRVADAGRKAADMRAEAGEIEQELAFSLSAGIGRLEPGRAKGQHKSRVEAEAVKREGQLERREALLCKAEQVLQEESYVMTFLDMLNRLPGFLYVGRVLHCRYWQGLTAKATSRALHRREAEIKRIEKKGLMCIGAVFLGLVEPGAYYDHDGLFVMGAAEVENLMKKWRGN